jgi:hypothetical protein
LTFAGQRKWIPAFAGMTAISRRSRESGNLATLTGTFGKALGPRFRGDDE